MREAVLFFCVAIPDNLKNLREVGIISMRRQHKPKMCSRCPRCPFLRHRTHAQAHSHAQLKMQPTNFQSRKTSHLYTWSRDSRTTPSATMTWLGAHCPCPWVLDECPAIESAFCSNKSKCHNKCVGNPSWDWGGAHIPGRNDVHKRNKWASDPGMSRWLHRTSYASCTRVALGCRRMVVSVVRQLHRISSRLRCSSHYIGGFVQAALHQAVPRQGVLRPVLLLLAKYPARLWCFLFCYYIEYPRLPNPRFP